RALICLENGSKVIKSYWTETQAGETEFTFTTTDEMSPNVYINITVLQPHAQTANDLPIRLYGVVPILVENPETHLVPEIEMPDVLRPEETVQIRISEKNDRDMTYTLAIVDEGLLDLTRFGTPDPWKYFYAREALGVRSWDIFNWVIGAYGAKIESLLSIGGGDDLAGKGGKKANRFKPMVKFIGPFYVKGGRSNTHNIEIPRYIGSVRTMVVAGHEKAYGSAEKTTPVRKPLMLLGTLPRVLGPGETVKLPVSVFAMEKNVKNVTVKLKTNDLLTVQGASSSSVTFSEPGEETITFDLKVNPGLGIGKVEIVAQSGKETATYEIELDVRTPNPEVTDFIAYVVDGGQTQDAGFVAFGIPGTNKAVLEVSSIPPLNLEKRLRYLVQYPHGCIEQTTSGAFPQLYLEDLVELDQERKQEISRNIKYAIQRLSSFQLSNGGLSYWPGSKDVSEWGTTYAGHFLAEAEKRGYTIPAGVMKNLVKYQKNKASNWSDDGPSSQLMQAYRLYMLALTDKAEIGAMNRLKEKTNLSKTANWRLAAAYYLAGKEKVAENMIEGLGTDVRDYTELSYTFGSSLRDQAMILETLSMMGKRKEAFALLKEISEDLSTERWYSTQTTAYSLIAVARYVNKNQSDKQLSFSYKVNNGSMEKVVSTKFVSQVNLPVKGKQIPLTMKNNGDGMIYARIIRTGIPETGDTTDAENDLKMSISYYTAGGIRLNPEFIEPGTDFYAEVEITHPGIRENYKELALTQIFPSGWEIINTRLLETGTDAYSCPSKYQDIRDDRVYTYFDLNRHKTKTFKMQLNASYTGTYYLPAVYCEAMYDHTINAKIHGQWVEVAEGH
ncbi:MAG: hypothetical protein KJ607_02210, partial [Bacteroidetes bacterium]|nr:hypothetical protein [Bacteroidota bacterium]